MTDLDRTTLMPRLVLERPPHDPWGEDAEHPPVASVPVPARRHRWHPAGALPWAVPTLVMAALGVLGVGRPALWSDELATWGMATVSWHDMFAVLHWVDLAIAPYYVLVHAWVGVAGASDLAIRLPSVVAMAAAAGLTGALGARLANRWVGLLAGLIFAVLPGTARYAQEARAYALTTFVAVLATFLVVGLAQRPAWWKYPGYVLSVAVLGVLHPVALLLLGAHGWIVFAYHRRRILPWVVAAALGSAPGAVLLWYSEKQKSQVAWIPRPSREVLLRFPEDLAGTAVLGVLLVALALFSLPLRRTAAVATAWAVLPFLGLVAAAQQTPIFLARYLLFTLPAWALLAALALGRARIWWGIAGLVLIAALGIPTQLQIRTPDGHGEATRQLADIVAQGERPGDGIVYGMTDDGGNWVGRDSIARYLPADQRPLDVLMTRPERTHGQLAAAECTDVAWCLRDATRLWVVRLGDRPDALTGLDGDKEEVLRQRFQVSQVWHLTGLTLALVVARPAA